MRVPYLGTRMNTGVADGARTHDNRNHNPSQQPFIYAASNRVGGKYLDIWYVDFTDFAGLGSHVSRLQTKQFRE